MLTSTLILLVFLAAMLVCAAVPAVLFPFNLRRFRAPHFGPPSPTPIAVLIPARNEERNIAACIRSVLRSREVDLQVIVCDDHSTDNTRPIVEQIAAADPRVGLLASAPLPAGWNGKQHACWQLAQQADFPVLLFLDADVRLDRWAIARALYERERRDVALLSGFPRILTIGFLDGLLLPLIHFVLLCYLPMRGLDRTTRPAYAAGCGQFMLVEREAYMAAGGHASLRASRHDGLLLPHRFRERGYRTAVVDLTRLAITRMYDSPRSTWNGLMKNAVEGIAAPARIVPFTLLLGLGEMLPGLLFFVYLVVLVGWIVLNFTAGKVNLADPDLFALCLFVFAIATVCSFLPRFVAARRFRQPMWSAWLHPVGVAVLLVLQWTALLRHLAGKPVSWRGRREAL